jgi:hypothetical protein
MVISPSVLSEQIGTLSAGFYYLAFIDPECGFVSAVDLSTSGDVIHV